MAMNSNLQQGCKALSTCQLPLYLAMIICHHLCKTKTTQIQTKYTHLAFLFLWFSQCLVVYFFLMLKSIFNAQSPRKIHLHARTGDVDTTEWLLPDTECAFSFFFHLITLSLTLPLKAHLSFNNTAESVLLTYLQSRYFSFCQHVVLFILVKAQVECHEAGLLSGGIAVHFLSEQEAPCSIKWLTCQYGEYISNFCIFNLSGPARSM